MTSRSIGFIGPDGGMTEKQEEAVLEVFGRLAPEGDVMLYGIDNESTFQLFSKARGVKHFSVVSKDVSSDDGVICRIQNCTVDEDYRIILKISHIVILALSEYLPSGLSGWWSKIMEALDVGCERVLVVGVLGENVLFSISKIRE